MTSEHTRELPGLPPGPATLALAKTYIDITDARDDNLLEWITEAVNAKIRSWPVAKHAQHQPTWPADIVLGASHFVARLFARRGTPQGYEAFGDGGAVFVQRIDPELAQALELGTYTKPQVG